MPYEVVVEGKKYRTDDLTLDEAIAIDVETKSTWGAILPLRSASDAKAVIRAFLLRDRTPEEAEAILSTFTAGKAVQAINPVADDLPDEYEDGLPKAEDGQETSTS